MKPRTYPLKIHQGSLLRRVFILKTNGQPADLTGFTARLQLRAEASEASPVLLEVSTGNGITIEGPEGRIVIEVSGRVGAAPSTASLAFEWAVWDLFLYGPTGEPQKIVGGPASLIKAVTHV